MNTKTIVLGGMMAGMAALIQSFPAVFSEALSFLTMFSVLPVYLITRVNPKIGILCFISAGVIIMFIRPQEDLFFLFVNGPTGFLLGLADRRAAGLAASPLIAAYLTAAVSCISRFLNVPVLGFQLNLSLSSQIAILYAVILLYTIVYARFTRVILRRIHLLLRL